MPLPDLLSIRPFTRPARGEVILPGSKSLTNRALLLAALCDSPVTLTGALFSEDTHLMADALRTLGFTVAADAAAKTLAVSGQQNAFRSDTPVELFVGLAGTAARFLTALCAAAPRGVYQIDGVPQMRQRPMRALIESLRSLGADVRCTGEEGFFPLEIHAHGLHGGSVAIDASESSQLLSALLMVAPLAVDPIEITPLGKIRRPFVDMTLNMMWRFGYRHTEWDRKTDRLRFVPQSNYTLPAASFQIESDATATSYFVALPVVVGGQIRITDYHFYRPMQGDVQFAGLLQERGLISGLNKQMPTHDVARGSNLTGIIADFSSFSDTFLTLAAIAPLLKGPTRITGIAHTRKQETDRVAGMVTELKRLGQDVDEHPDKDGLTITPRPLRSGQTIETYGDHRFAMSFAILGCHNLHGDGQPWLTIRDPACCAKTFPNFFDVLADVWRNSHPGKQNAD